MPLDHCTHLKEEGIALFRALIKRTEVHDDFEHLTRTHAAREALDLAISHFLQTDEGKEWAGDFKEFYCGTKCPSRFNCQCAEEYVSLYPKNRVEQLIRSPAGV